MDEVVLGLRAKLEEHRRSQARRAGWTRRVVPMGLVRIDARLPGGGRVRLLLEMLNGRGVPIELDGAQMEYSQPA